MNHVSTRTLTTGWMSLKPSITNRNSGPVNANENLRRHLLITIAPHNVLGYCRV